MKKSENKPTVTSTKNVKVKGATKSSKISEEEQFDIDTAKLEKIVKKVKGGDSIDDDIIESLKEIQRTAGTADSQRVLDKLIAVQKAKSSGNLEEFLRDNEDVRKFRERRQKELTGLTTDQKRGLHNYIVKDLNADEYIAVVMTQIGDHGLQTEVLTQLPKEAVLKVLQQLIDSISNDLGESGDVDIKD